MCTEHRSSEKNQKNLCCANRKHDQKKALVFSDVHPETNAARSRIERIENTAKDKYIIRMTEITKKK